MGRKMSVMKRVRGEVVKGADQKVDVEMKGKKDEEGRGVKRV